jgi:hypothetical protein
MVPSECVPQEHSKMVMSVGFDNLKYFGQFWCPALGDRSHHQSLIGYRLRHTL